MENCAMRSITVLFSELGLFDQRKHCCLLTIVRSCLPCCLPVLARETGFRIGAWHRLLNCVAQPLVWRPTGFYRRMMKGSNHGESHHHDSARPANSAGLRLRDPRAKAENSSPAEPLGAGAGGRRIPVATASTR